MKFFQINKLPIRLWPDYFAVAVQAYGTSAIFFLSLYLTVQLHYSVIQAGTTLTCWGIGTFFGSIFSPIFSRWLGERPTVIVTLLGMAIVFFLLTYLQTLPWINSLILLHGILSYAFIPANQVWVLSQVSDEQRVYANNIWRISKNILISIGFLLNGYLSHINFTLMLDITGIILFVGGTITLFAQCSQQHNGVSLMSKVKNPARKKPHRDLRLYAIYFVIFCIGLIYSQLNSNYPLFLHEIYQISAKGYGLLFALNTWLVILLQIPLLYWCRHIPHVYIIALGTLGIGLGLGILNAGHTWPLAIFSCLLWSLGEILFFSLSEVTLIDYAHEQTKVLFMSLYQFIYSLGAMLGPLGGSIIYHFNNGALLWYGCALLGLFCCSIFFFLKNYS